VSPVQRILRDARLLEKAFGLPGYDDADVRLALGQDG
jgi:hypothetical protein